MSKQLLDTPVLIASDHAGYELKEFLKIYFTGRINFIDLGSHSKESVDYPDFADAVGTRLNSEKGPEKFGVLICGSGVGICIRANRYLKVRAVQVWNKDIARLSREHNDANVICLGARVQDANECVNLIEIFLSTAFLGAIKTDGVNQSGDSEAAARHYKRVKKLETPIR